MPDYIYLLENRLSVNQRHALQKLREVARDAGIILFLTGDAVRDLTSGHAVRDIEVAVHGSALKLKKSLEKAGVQVWGEDEPSRTLYLAFPGSVRIDLVSTHRAEYPKPGKPVYHWASIQEDLRRRDFTANAMAISLNDGSYGLLMDPLNGVADIEARTLRLVSNYGFLESPALLIRATRFKTRLGWELDPRTQSRYENAKQENVIEHLSAHDRSFELEQIGHEDEGLKVLAALEAEGWMKDLFPAWTVSKADETKLKALHDLSAELQMQGVHPEMSAAQMQLLTAKMPAKDVAALKKMLVRPGFVEEWNSLDAIAAAFAKALITKPPLSPSGTFKLLTSYDPKAVLWLGFTTNSAAVKDRYEQFLKVWPEARQRIPYLLMQEMRITPDLPTYKEIIEKIFLELIDGKLTTPEETKAFLEPFSPPAPPPQITIKRTRARRGAEAKVKERTFEDDEETGDEEEGDLDDAGGDDEDADMGLPKLDLADDDEESGGEDEDEEDDEEDGDEEPAPKRGKKAAATKAPEAPKPSKSAPAPAAKPAKEATKSVPPAKQAPAIKPAAGTKPVAAAKPAPGALKAKAPVVPHSAKKTPPPPAKKAAKPAPAPHKAAAKPAPKPVAKAKPALKPAPAKKKPAPKLVKPAAKKPAKKR